MVPLFRSIHWAPRGGTRATPRRSPRRGVRARSTARTHRPVELAADVGDSLASTETRRSHGRSGRWRGRSGSNSRHRDRRPVTPTSTSAVAFEETDDVLATCRRRGMRHEGVSHAANVPGDRPGPEPGYATARVDGRSPTPRSMPRSRGPEAGTTAFRRRSAAGAGSARPSPQDLGLDELGEAAGSSAELVDEHLVGVLHPQRRPPQRQPLPVPDERFLQDLGRDPRTGARTPPTAPASRRRRGGRRGPRRRSPAPPPPRSASTIAARVQRSGPTRRPPRRSARRR